MFDIFFYEGLELNCFNVTVIFNVKAISFSSNVSFKRKIIDFFIVNNKFKKMRMI